MFHVDLKITLESDNTNVIFHQSDNGFMHKEQTHFNDKVMFLIRKRIEI
jgi:hypothetical protein